MKSVRPNIRAALVRDGLSFRKSPEELEAELARAMGTKRHAAHVRAFDRYASGRGSARDLYLTMCGPQEAALFQSHDAEQLLDAAVRVYEAVVRPLPTGARVVELGAFSGAMLRALAALRPDLAWTGVDRASELLGPKSGPEGEATPRLLARSYAALTRRDLGGPADAVLAVCAVNFSRRAPAHSDSEPLDRRSPIHVAVRAEADEFFAAMARVARKGASCTAIFRVPTLARAYALTDAAAARGLREDPSRSHRFRFRGDPFLQLTVTRT